jgi:isoquinoline 1-oxidoreductase beta subunit
MPASARPSTPPPASLNPHKGMSISNTTADGLSRRSFLKASALAGGGLMLGFYLGGRNSAEADPAAADFSPNAFIQITPGGRITILAKNPEIGQGIKTTLPMIIAEELEVPWESVTVEQAGLNPALGGQFAGGSSGVPSNYDNLRHVGATARTLLVSAAALTWNVPETECVADSGAVLHKPSNRRATYGDLAAKAATLPPPDPKTVTLKDPKDFKILGRRIGGVDNHKIVTGQPLFGIDTVQPGLLYAVYERCPVFGGKFVSGNLDAIKKMPGVKDAFAFPDGNGAGGLEPGVAVVADSTWSAFKARKALQIVWDTGGKEGQSIADFSQQADAAGKTPPQKQIANTGNAGAVFSSGAKTVEAAYFYPFVAHATLEPQNCTALFTTDGKMEIWAPSQTPGGGAQAAAKVAGIPPENITLHLTRIGGGFGRRLANDYVSEAAAIAQKMQGSPVKVMWTREQDIQHDDYRTAGWHYLKGAVDGQGKLAAWSDHIVALGHNNTMHGDAEVGGGEFPSAFVPNFQLGATVLSSNTPMGPMRAPGANANAWVFMSFVDEMAHAAGRDPLAFSMDLLSVPQPAVATPPPGGRRGRGPWNAGRMKACLQLATQKAGWPKQLPKGEGQGLAYYFSYGGYVAIVADVSVSKAGAVRVNKLTAAVDIGPVMNLSGAENQVQGAMTDGLSIALRQQITIDKGCVQQSNFHDYQLLRMLDAPPVLEVHFIQTGNHPSGLGEPALPSAAPAVCNAIFAATGKRIRSLPISQHDLSWS